MASTLYEYYTNKGQALPSLQDRSKLYEQYGLGSSSSYGGTAEQNTSLLNTLLKQGSTQTSGAYINPQTQQSFPIGTASPGYTQQGTPTPPKVVEPSPMVSNTSAGQTFLNARSSAGLPVDALTVQSDYRSSGLVDKYGEWRGTNEQYNALHQYDIDKTKADLDAYQQVLEASQKAGYQVGTGEDIRVDQQGNILPSASVAPTKEFVNPNVEDYAAITQDVIDSIGTTDLASLISDFSSGALTTPEMELTKEDKQAQLDSLKAAAAQSLQTMQKNLANQGMTFSGIRTTQEANQAAEVLSREAGINRSFAGKIIAAARQEQSRRENALSVAEDNYNKALQAQGYVYNPITGTIEKTLAREQFEQKQNATPNYPTSYDEWQLAGGLEGTGKTYNQWLDKKTTEEKPLYTEKDFYSAIDRGKTDLQQGESWGNVWNRIKQQFPNMSNDIIDNALGVSWREPNAYQNWVAMKKASGGQTCVTNAAGVTVCI